MSPNARLLLNPEACPSLALPLGNLKESSQSPKSSSRASRALMRSIASGSIKSDEVEGLNEMNIEIESEDVARKLIY